MLPDRVSNPGPLTYESGALPIALRGPAKLLHQGDSNGTSDMVNGSTLRIIIYINISTGIAFTKSLVYP